MRLIINILSWKKIIKWKNIRWRQRSWHYLIESSTVWLSALSQNGLWRSRQIVHSNWLLLVSSWLYFCSHLTTVIYSYEQLAFVTDIENYVYKNRICIIENWVHRIISNMCTIMYKNFFVSWIKRDQLDVTCFIISLITAQHVSNVSTFIFRSLRLIVDLSHGFYCSGSMCVSVTVWFGWGGVVSLCRLKLWCHLLYYFSI